MWPALCFLVQEKSRGRVRCSVYASPALFVILLSPPPPLSVTQRHTMSACLTNRVPSLPSPAARHCSAFFVRLSAAMNFRSHASSYIQLGGEITFCLGKLCHLRPGWGQPCNRDTLCQPFWLWWHQSCVSGRGYLPELTYTCIEDLKIKYTHWNNKTCAFFSPLYVLFMDINEECDGKIIPVFTLRIKVCVLLLTHLVFLPNCLYSYYTFCFPSSYKPD